MTLQPQIKLSENTSRQEISSTLSSLMLYSDADAERLAHSDKAEIKNLLTQAGDAELAQARIDDFLPKARQCDPSREKLIKIILTFVGAITFSAAPQLLASGSARGPLAWVAGFVGGGTVTFVVDELGVKGITKKRRRHNSQQACQFLKKQWSSHPSQTEFVKFFHKAQETRLLQIEGENLTTDFNADLIASGILSIVEGGTAFWLILPGGIGLALLAACFPVALTWAGICYQSEHFDFSKYSADMVEKYKQFLPPTEVTETEARKIQSLDYSFKYVVEGDRTGQVKNLSMARAYFDINYANKKLHHFTNLYLGEINQRKLELREQILKLEDQWVTPKIDIAGHAPTEEEYHYDTQESQKAAWIASKTSELEAICQEDVEMITLKYQQHFIEWQQEKARAEEVFVRG